VGALEDVAATAVSTPGAVPGADGAGPGADGAGRSADGRRLDAADRYALPRLPTLVPHRPRAASLAEKAYLLIRDRIIRLDLPPGATVNERALMAELDVGRTPVREALHRLADQRLVGIVPRRGIFVTPIDIRDLGAISEVRTRLEGYAGRLAATRASSAQRAETGALLDHLAARHPEADQTELIELDQLVHRHVHRCTHNAYLQATLEEYFVLSLRLWFLVLDNVARLEPAVQEHRDLLAAVRDGDAATAERVLQAHITGFETEIRRAL
jgi:DNA-binding GntR family transcriptional regulator